MPACDLEDRGFLADVIRFCALDHDTDRRRCPQYVQLEAQMREPVVGGQRAAFEHRAFRRHGVRVSARVRADGIEAPCEVFDVGGRGAGLFGSLRHLAVGDRVTLVVEPDPGERVDMPSEVAWVDDDAQRMGVRFTGAPLRLRCGARSRAADEAVDPAARAA